MSIDDRRTSHAIAAVRRFSIAGWRMRSFGRRSIQPAVLHNLFKGCKEFPQIAGFGKDRTGTLVESQLPLVRPGITNEKDHRYHPTALAQLKSLVKFEAGVMGHVQIKQQDAGAIPEGKPGGGVCVVGHQNLETVSGQIGRESIRHLRVVVHDKNPKPEDATRLRSDFRQMRRAADFTWTVTNHRPFPGRWWIRVFPESALSSRDFTIRAVRIAAGMTELPGRKAVSMSIDLGGSPNTTFSVVGGMKPPSCKRTMRGSIASQRWQFRYP
jgi:hypothetical protein